MNSDTEKAFTIVKGKLSLNFVYNISGGIDFPLAESVKGFYSGDTEVDSLNVESLGEDGLHYIVVDKNEITSSGWIYKPNYILPRYFQCDGELMSINGGQLVEYSKIKELPFEALSRLYKRGRLDRRDYIKEYLNLKVLAIKSAMSIVYSEPNKPTKVRLNRDGVVVVIEETGKWLKIKYGEDGLGWIKKEDAK